MTEPLPCPFCGEAPDVSNKVIPTLTNEREFTSISCEHVPCNVRPHFSAYVPREQAIERWNTRAPEST